MEPLSNAEVLKVLRGRKNHTKISQEFKDYLEAVENKQDNPMVMEKLRTIKDISPEVLCMVANNQSLDHIDSNYDRRKIEKVINN